MHWPIRAADDKRVLDVCRDICKSDTYWTTDSLKEFGEIMALYGYTAEGGPFLPDWNWWKWGYQ